MGDLLVCTGYIHIFGSKGVRRSEARTRANTGGKQTKKNQPRTVGFLKSGGDEEDRTPDLRIANATLSQLSYVPVNPLPKIFANILTGSTH